MERQFDNGDFEKLLRDNANQYRMYPSEKVWNGVHSALHSRRKWYGISALALLLVLGSMISIFVLNKNEVKTALANNKNIPVALHSQSIPTEQTVEKINQQVSVRVAQNKQPVEIRNNDNTVKPEIETVLPGTDFTETNEIISSPKEILSFKNITDTHETVQLNDGIRKQMLPLSASVVSAEENSEISTAVNSEQSLLTDSKIRDAVNALSSQRAPIPVHIKHARFTTQVYFTPTVSYRKLIENKNLYVNSGYVNAPVLDLNNYVKHKPAMGLEFGIEGKYSLNERLSIKSGLQFNINRYDIRAYSHSTEIATVAVSNGYRTDSLAAYSNYRNFSGTNANWLENFYFQAAFPVGAELILTKRKGISWGISGTIQPTYVIGDRAYLISSDYKNYARFPDLMRRWNISSGVETFVTYSTRKIKWQVGPHLRYQHLSSFVSRYPVKENLFAAGLKIGATFNNTH